MIHIIPHHLNGGSWIKWHKLIHFKESDEVSYYNVDDPSIYERFLLPFEEYPSHLEIHLKNINPKQGDIVFCDMQYFPYWNPQIFESFICDLAIKYGIKIFIVDGDNFRSYTDTEHYTIFSNRFDPKYSDVNFNYFRYRLGGQSYFKHIPELFTPFLETIRQKKGNFIVGVDKVERLLSLKHIFDTGIDKDFYVGYSGFSRGYDDMKISDSLKKFRDSKLPIILDTTFEKSCNGAVNVEYPPFPFTINSYVSAICETSVSLDEIHLSEKSWNPFISLNIPLVLGSRQINSYLRNLGFWMAEDLFDISEQSTYVDIVNQYKSNLDIINNMSYDDIYGYFLNNKTRMLRNHTILGNQKFVFNRNNYK
jgi:hypothetical protein